MEMSKTVEPASGAPFGALITMFYEPARTFAALERRKAAWLPTILLMLSTGALLLWYFGAVDFAWLMEQMFGSIKNAAEREKMISMMNPNVMRVTSVVGAVVALPIMLTLMAVYFMITGKVISKDFTFGSGFALSAWASVPTLLNFPLGAIQILLASNGQLSFSELNPLSLNTLFFRYDLVHPMTGLLDSVSVTSVWSAFLLIIGFQTWAKVSRATAVKVVLIAYASMYGIWLAIALSKAA
jgi:hypothetical protein